MINGLEGIPGSGKSYEGVVYHVLEALKTGRKVITNLPLNLDAFAAIDPAYRDLIELRTRPAPQLGVWDATDIAERPAFQLWTDKDPVPPPEHIFTFGTVWDFYTTWRGKNGQGPLYVIDECHVAFPKLGTPDSVVQWFKLHRHFNADVLLMTQSFRDINQPIAQLIATLIKVRKADVIGEKGYIRKVHAGYRGAMIQQNRRKYESQYFQLYRSNTQSGGSAEAGLVDVDPFLKKWKLFSKLFYVAGAAFCVWAFWPQDGRTFWGAKTGKPAEVATAVANPVDTFTQVGAPRTQHRQQQKEQEPVKEAAPPPPAEPLSGKGLHLTGYLKIGGRMQATFVVSSEGRRIFDVTSDDLQKAGYEFSQLSDCMGWVVYDGKRRPVTCDAPALADGSQGRPLVVDSGSGARSDS